MKVWYLLLGIIVCFIIVASPVVAISKRDLISYYKGQSSPAMPIPTPTPSLEENTTVIFPPWPITPAGPPPPSKLTLWIQSEKQRYIDKGICCMGADPANPLCPICPIDPVPKGSDNATIKGRVK